jgi:hypothetical protein
MAAIVDPAEAVLLEVDRYLDPRRTLDGLLPLLAHWLALEHLLEPGGVVSDTAGTSTPFAPGAGRLRELLATATSLAQVRGTPQGLSQLLATATGVDGYVIDEHSAGSFHLRVVCPAGASSWRGLVERIVETEKPAHMTHVVEFAEAATP